MNQLLENRLFLLGYALFSMFVSVSATAEEKTLPQPPDCQKEILLFADMTQSLERTTLFQSFGVNSVVTETDKSRETALPVHLKEVLKEMLIRGRWIKDKDHSQFWSWDATHLRKMCRAEDCAATIDSLHLKQETGSGRPDYLQGYLWKVLETAKNEGLKAGERLQTLVLFYDFSSGWSEEKPTLSHSEFENATQPWVEEISNIPTIFYFLLLYPEGVRDERFVLSLEERLQKRRPGQVQAIEITRDFHWTRSANMPNKILQARQKNLVIGTQLDCDRGDCRATLVNQGCADRVLELESKEVFCEEAGANRSIDLQALEDPDRRSLTLKPGKEVLVKFRHPDKAAGAGPPREACGDWLRLDWPLKQSFKPPEESSFQGIIELDNEAALKSADLSRVRRESFFGKFLFDVWLEGTIKVDTEDPFNLALCKGDKPLAGLELKSPWRMGGQEQLNHRDNSSDRRTTPEESRADCHRLTFAVQKSSLLRSDSWWDRYVPEMHTFGEGDLRIVYFEEGSMGEAASILDDIDVASPALLRTSKKKDPEVARSGEQSVVHHNFYRLPIAWLAILILSCFFPTLVGRLASAETLTESGGGGLADLGYGIYSVILSALAGLFWAPISYVIFNAFGMAPNLNTLWSLIVCLLVICGLLMFFITSWLEKGLMRKVMKNPGELSNPSKYKEVKSFADKHRIGSIVFFVLGLVVFGFLQVPQTISAHREIKNISKQDTVATQWQTTGDSPKLVGVCEYELRRRE